MCLILHLNTIIFLWKKRDPNQSFCGREKSHVLEKNFRKKNFPA